MRAYDFASQPMITRFQVRNFKSLWDIDLELGPINVLVGPNMSGKSNIMAALQFLQEFMFPQQPLQGVNYAVARQGGISEVIWKGERKGQITGTAPSRTTGISMESLAGAGPEGKYKYELELVTGAGDFVSLSEESLKFVRSGVEHDLTTQNQGMAWVKNADGQPLGGVGSTAASAIERPVLGWDGNAFREWMIRWRFYHLIPPAMRQSGPISEGEVLEANGKNLSAWMMWLQAHSADAFHRVSEVLQDLFPEIVWLKAIPTTEGRVYLAVREKELTRDTRVFQMSDGFLALTALLSLIYAPPELAGTVVCIEEPENYLHPRLMETVVSLLRQAREEILGSGRSPTQFILTTQSPYLLDQFSLEEVIWVEKRNGQTKAYHPANREHLKKLIEDKDLGLGDLMYSGALGEEK